jgi:hypothetical protein
MGSKVEQGGANCKQSQLQNAAFGSTLACQHAQ